MQMQVVILWTSLYLSFYWTHTVLSTKSITGGYTGIARRLCINSEGGYSAPEANKKMKTGWVYNNGCISGTVWRILML